MEGARTARQLDQRLTVRRARRAARTPVTCTTCGRIIASGEVYCRDTWGQRILGHVISSSICRDCVDDGL